MSGSSVQKENYTQLESDYRWKIEELQVRQNLWKHIESGRLAAREVICIQNCRRQHEIEQKYKPGESARTKESEAAHEDQSAHLKLIDRIWQPTCQRNWGMYDALFHNCVSMLDGKHRHSECQLTDEEQAAEVKALKNFSKVLYKKVSSPWVNSANPGGNTRPTHGSIGSSTNTSSSNRPKVPGQ